MNSPTAKLVVKFVVLLAPAIVIALLLGFGGSALKIFAMSLSVPKSHRLMEGSNTFYVPDKHPDWAVPTKDFLEAFRDRFTRDQPFQGRTLAHPMKPLTQGLIILVTNDRAGFEKEAQGETRSNLPFSGGWFNPTKGKITLFAESPGEIWSTLSHELVHATMHHSYDNPAFSPWLGEGVAQWGETTDAKAEAQLGRAPNVQKLKAARQELKTGAAVRASDPERRIGPLESILRAGQDRFAGANNLWYYQCAYALVCFLLDEKVGLRDGFLAYYDEETAPGPLDSPVRFAERIGPLDQIERRWLEWAEQWR